MYTAIGVLQSPVDGLLFVFAHPLFDGLCLFFRGFSSYSNQFEIRSGDRLQRDDFRAATAGRE